MTKSLKRWTRPRLEKALRAMDLARYGRPVELINWSWKRATFIRAIERRLAAGEQLPVEIKGGR